MNKLFTAAISLALSSTLFAGMGEQKMEQKQEQKQMQAMPMYQSVKPDQAQLLQSGDEKMYCPMCAMNLVAYYKTSHAAKLADGSAKQYCSIHCLVEDMEYGELSAKKANVKEIFAVDHDTLKLIDAKKAFYVVGSNKPGTMTMTSQYVFESKEAAEAFAKASGGEVMDFDGTYKVAQTSFMKDVMMIQNKRSSKMYPMGETLYNEKCDKVKLDSLHIHSIGALKALIKNSKVCGEVDEMQAQALSLYVWDVKLQKLENLKKSAK